MLHQYQASAIMSYRRYQGFTLGPIGYLIVTNLILYIAVSIKPKLFVDIFGFEPRNFLAMPWTILSSMFIHQPFPDFSHIIANMLTLYFFGSYLLRLVGEKRFFIVYFIGGIIGNIFFMLWVFTLLPDFISPTAIGASGAIFAVAGALTVMRPKETVFIFPIPVPIPLWVAVIGGFLVLFFIPYVAWQAHLGGLVFGLIAGYFFRNKGRRFY